MNKIMKNAIELATKGPLPVEIATEAFSEIMNGNASESQIGGFLIALKTRGETVEEIATAAQVMLSQCRKVNAPIGAMDIVGTGGDGKGTFNISTATAIVVASTGITVAKHGNKNISSKSGAADVLQQLGVGIMTEPTVVELCIEKANIGFMMAPIHHPAVKYVMPARQMLGTRTIFNILGPLTNPAGVKYQLTGAYNKGLLVPMAETLRLLGSKKAWMVHGKDGTDEISISGSSYIVELKNNKINSFEISPTDAGLSTHTFESIRGGTPSQNADAIKALISGKISPFRDSVLLNAAAAMIIAEKTTTLKEGVRLAATAIDSGASAETLRVLSKITSEK